MPKHHIFKVINVFENESIIFSKAFWLLIQSIQELFFIEERFYQVFSTYQLSIYQIKVKQMQGFHSQLMRRACDLASESVKNHTGPFGAVIADKKGNIIAEGNNMVTLLNDPTMHAEMSVIRNACKKLGTFKLDGLVIYSSCEPCPMCLGAIYWARLQKLYFGNGKQDAKEIGFDDQFIYQQIAKPHHERAVQAIQLQRQYAQNHFKEWQNKDNKIQY